jgi:hypothetical protein
MGPEPMIRMDWMELSLGIFFLSDRADQVIKNGISWIAARR